MVSKQNMIAVILILLGVILTQLKPQQPFTVGLGVGTIVIASLWIVLLIVRDLKKK
jgi:L-asparagine transporter-like permease